MKTLAISLIGCLCAISATAATTTYSDRATFLAASGDATDHTTAPFNFTGSRAYSNGLTVNEVSGTFGSTSVIAFADLGISDAIVVNDVESLDFNFSEQRFGFGLDIVESTTPFSASRTDGCGVTTCVESTFTFTFLNGGSVVGSEVISPANDTVVFFGVTSDLGFDKVEMRETTGSNDDERFGGFVSTAAPAPVPLPASALLLLAGVGGLAAMRRKA